MATIMGEAYPDLYAAVGVHSGLAPGAAHDLSSAFTAMRGGSPGGVVSLRRVAGESARTVPTIVFYGDCDTTLPPRNGDQLIAHFATTSGNQESKEAQALRGGYVKVRCPTGITTLAPPIMTQAIAPSWSGGQLTVRTRLVGWEPPRLVHRP
jgi:hypothetical protein